MCYHGGLHAVDASHLGPRPRLDRDCQTLAFGVAKSQNAILARLAHDHLDAASLGGAARALGFGESLTTLRGGFAVGAIQEHELRLVPKDAFSVSLSRYQWEAGPRLGPVEPMARVGFTLLHLDVGHGVSFGMFSPRVGFGLWLSLPHSRVGVSAFTEYFWRWLGNDSAFVHGLTLEFQPDAGPLIRPKPTSSPSSQGRQ